MNAEALAVLDVEISRPAIDKPLAEATAQEIERRAVRDWGDLDRLAFRRAAAWLIHADGLGQGVTADEHKSITDSVARLHDLPRVARGIIVRLAEAVEAPGIDDAILTSWADTFVDLLPQS